MVPSLNPSLPRMSQDLHISADMNMNITAMHVDKVLRFASLVCGPVSYLLIVLL